MNYWRWIWFDERSGRVRSGWRALVFLLAGLIMTGLLENVLLSSAQTDSTAPVTLPLYARLLITSLAMIAACLGISLWALRVFDRIPQSTLGLALRGRNLRGALYGFLLGFAVMLLFLLLLLGTGLAHYSALPLNLFRLSMAAVVLCLAFLDAAALALLFRGYLLQTLLRDAGPLTALAVSGLCFAAYCYDDPHITLLGVANIFVLGMVLGLLYLRTASLWWPIGLHAGWNGCLWLFSLPGNDIGLRAVLPYSLTLTGNSWIVGGAFGPEGGVVISAILLLGAAVLTLPRVGLPLTSRWWEWREFLVEKLTPPWDFAIGSRQYQWKMLLRDNGDS